MEGGDRIMVNYPDFSNLSGNPTIADFMALPNSSYPFFWAWILAGIWMITVLTSYFAEKLLRTKGNILSSMAVACFAILVLALLGTFFKVVSVEIMIYIIVISAVIIGVWMFSR